MGCDIHLVVERRAFGKWVGVRTFQHFHDLDGKVCISAVETRNYARFAKLAGVRGDGPPANGAPNDMSDLSRLLIEQYGRDGHHHSHMSAERFAQIVLETAGNPSTFAQQDPVSYYFRLISDIDGPASDYRVVFWFDS
jgi:hypothetical protein